MASRKVRLFRWNTERLQNSVIKATKEGNLESLNLLKTLKRDLNRLLEERADIENAVYDAFENLQAEEQPLNYDEFDLVKITNSSLDIIRDIEWILEAKEEKLTNARISQIDVKMTSPREESNASVPVIKLPIFEDGFVEWVEFFDLFKAQIDSRKNLSKTEKLMHLKNSLKGAALNKIKGLSIIESNYEIALKVLKDYYESERQIIFQTIDKLLEFPKIKILTREKLNYIYDHFRNAYSVLQNFKKVTPGNDDFFIRILIRCIPQDFIHLFYRTLNSETVPTVSNFFEFLDKEIRSWNAMETVNYREASTSKYQSTSPKMKNKYLKTLSTVVTNKINKCFFCNQENHKLDNCFKFKKLSFSEKMNFILKMKICKLCFKANHDFLLCKSIQCHCGNYHNPILHASKIELNDYFKNVKNKNFKSIENVNNSNVQNINEVVNVSETPKKTCCTNLPQIQQNILLGTAMVKLQTSEGKFTARCLVDTASQSNFITNELASKLKVKVTKENNTPIYGLGSRLVSCVTGSVNVKISPINNNFLAIDCPSFTVEKICDNLERFQFNINEFSHLKNLQLADPEFHCGGPVDMLLGSKTVAQILRGGVKRGSENAPVAIESVLGWILLGNCPSELKEQATGQVKSYLTLEYLSKKLWSLDNPTEIDPVKFDQCEKHFLENYFRLPSGKFSVALPFKNPHLNLGESKQGALKRFFSLEKKFEAKLEFKIQYSNCISDLFKLDFAEIVSNPSINDKCFYLPHHAVIREQSLSTKMRIVFDGSAKTENSISLNQILMTGRPLQSDIRSILTKFRHGSIGFTFDIQKMYNMILINEQDRDFLRFLWRSEPSEPVQTFRLKTLPFGLKSSPFLALRVLIELANLEGYKFPKAKAVLDNCFYMDDGFVSVDSKEEAEAIILEVKSLLREGGFFTDKWASNNSYITQLVREEGNYSKIIAENPVTNTLGLIWNTKFDSFQISYTNNKNVVLTKRKLLSELAQTFDPLGFMSPVLIKFKIIFQQLCKQKLEWDQPVNDRVNLIWSEYQEDLKLLKGFYIPRFIGAVKPEEDFFLLGYCDASELAYSAVIYLVRGIFQKTLQVSQGWLVGSRTRVAPLKTVSLPRLELAGALVLSEFLHFIKPSILIPFKGIICLTDSMITLSWIQSEPYRWQTFVANRVAKIQEYLPDASWQYVKSEDNLADMGSRGIYLKELIEKKEWWRGPKGSLPLSPPPSLSDNDRQVCLKEEKKTLEVYLNKQNFSFLQLFSSYLKTVRVLAIMLRWLAKIKKRNLSKNFGQPLNEVELKGAHLRCIQLSQLESFPHQIKNLEENKEVKWPHGLMGLNPFFDSEKIIRIKDRLELLRKEKSESCLIMLDYQNPFTFKIIHYYHVLYFHAGAKFLINFVRTRYYIPRLTKLVKKVIYKCIVCFKAKPKCMEQQMAPLPLTRITPARPFTNCSVDYAGPFLVRNKLGRKGLVFKAYVLVLVCHATKAIHLELVTNLTSENFIAAFKRFIARRGMPYAIFSDCGRTFLGANAQLKKDLKLLIQLEPSSADHLAQFEVKWNFHPPYAPHFSGLVEAAVKSFKTHLYKIGKVEKYSYEELSTLLCQIEAILNSRPLCSRSINEGYDTLTPGHFLTGSELLTPPEPDLRGIKEGRLSRWQLVQQKVQGFWRDWVNDYRISLLKRTRWRGTHPPLNEGQLVLIFMPTPPLDWPLGRIEKLIVGADGYPRVADVRTSKGLFRRAITQIAPLPIE